MDHEGIAYKGADYSERALARTFSSKPMSARVSAVERPDAMRFSCLRTKAVKRPSALVPDGVNISACVRPSVGERRRTRKPRACSRSRIGTRV